MLREAVSAISITREQEQAEAAAVLASEMFQRAPNLSAILSYVCERYFAGEAARIKEYIIAVDALGRGADFDPNEDTIVRVEASRLRKRLREYYAAEGAGHAIQLLLPKSGYVPQFVPAAVEPATPLRPLARPRRSRRSVQIAAAALATGGLVFASVMIWRVRKQQVHISEAPVAALTGTALRIPLGTPAGEVRILAGFSGPQFLDSLGHTWISDHYFTGGTARETIGNDILGVLDPTIYRTSRRGDFRYDIPLPVGVYELRLLFVERGAGQTNRVYAGEGSRVFHVSINGERRLTALDILADAGAPNIPADRVLKDISPATDGFLHLEFTSVAGGALLNGIEIQRGISGKMRPVRIVAGGRSYYDRKGRFWGTDRYFVGGRPYAKPGIVIQGTSDPELYANERWGHFTYSIPVPVPGRYKATLKFAETNFGQSVRRSWTGADRRIFDVFCNGVALLRNFDILKETGRENQTLDKVFRGLTPNAQGKLVFSFVPVQEYATVRAIEVVDDGS